MRGQSGNIKVRALKGKKPGGCVCVSLETLVDNGIVYEKGDNKFFVYTDYNQEPRERVQRSQNEHS